MKSALSPAIVSHYASDHANQLSLARKRRFFKKLWRGIKNVGKKILGGVKKVGKKVWNKTGGSLLRKVKNAAIKFLKRKFMKYKEKIKKILIKKIKNAVVKVLIKVNKVLKVAIGRLGGTSRKYDKKKSWRKIRMFGKRKSLRKSSLRNSRRQKFLHRQRLLRRFRNSRRKNRRHRG